MRRVRRQSVRLIAEPTSAAREERFMTEAEVDRFSTEPVAQSVGMSHNNFQRTNRYFACRGEPSRANRPCWTNVTRYLVAVALEICRSIWISSLSMTCFFCAYLISLSSFSDLFVCIFARPCAWISRNCSDSLNFGCSGAACIGVCGGCAGDCGCGAGGVGAAGADEVDSGIAGVVSV